MGCIAVPGARTQGTRAQQRGNERGLSDPHPPTSASIWALGRDKCIHAQTLHRVGGSRERMLGLTPQPVCVCAQSRLFSSAAAPEDSRKIFVGNLAWKVRSRALSFPWSSWRA